MLYLIKDVYVCPLTGHEIPKTIKIAQSEEEVLKYLSKVENLKKFKHDIKIEKVML